MPAITALRISNRRKTQVEIDLDGEPWMTVDAEVVVRLGLKLGGNLDGSALKAIETENAFVAARQRAIRFCLRQPRTVLEIHRRLKEDRCDAATIERVMAELRGQRLVEDREVARRQARRGKKTRIGPLRVEAELAARGVADDLLDSELEPLRDPEWQRREVEALARKRLARLAGRPREERQRKVGEYLLRRGFDPQIVQEVVGHLLPED